MNLTDSENKARDKLCLSLDGFEDMEHALSIASEMKLFAAWIKIGDIFTRFGPAIIKPLKDMGYKVFLDLKYHDVPDTVKRHSKAASDLGVDMFTVHSFGGSEMIRHAVEGASQSKNKPKIIAVTILTSIDKSIMNKDLNIQEEVESQVLHLANLSYSSGADGIVCSATDIDYIKNNFSGDFIIVTPGIISAASYDQKRTSSAGEAIRRGSHLVVIGRAIISFETPEERSNAAYSIIKDMANNI